MDLFLSPLFERSSCICFGQVSCIYIEYMLRLYNNFIRWLGLVLVHGILGIRIMMRSGVSHIHMLLRTMTKESCITPVTNGGRCSMHGAFSALKLLALRSFELPIWLFRYY
jgi:hypothetical protein